MITSGYYDDAGPVIKAVDFFRELLVEFPMSDWRIPTAEENEPEQFGLVRVEVTPGYSQSRSQAVQMAAMFSQFCYAMLPRDALRMGFVYNANSQRSGKSLLCKTAIVPVNGKMAVQSWSKDEDMRKVLDAEAIRGSRYIVFDNVKGFVGSAVVEAFMTTPMWTGRILGKSEMFEAPISASIYITGNELALSPDMANRCLTVDLQVEQAEVQERIVKHPIDDSWLLQMPNRMKILSALATIVNHWNEAGRPKATAKLRLGFEPWCNVIASLVEYAGFGNCLEEPVIDNAGDTESKDARALVVELVGESTERRIEYVFQEIVNTCHQEGLFSWLLEDGKKEGDDYVLREKANSRFGKTLRKYAPLKPHVRTFRLPVNRVVRFSCDGKNRQRRFILEMD